MWNEILSTELTDAYLTKRRWNPPVVFDNV